LVDKPCGLAPRWGCWFSENSQKHFIK
jgi:hypothetical protein